MADDFGLVAKVDARLDAFERKMKEAGLIADREVSNIERRFETFNPVFSGTLLGTAVSRITSDLVAGAIQSVKDMVDRFIQLENVAKLAGIAMHDAFGQQEAAKKFGVPVEETTKGIRELATLLNQVGRGEENSLSRLFEANNKSLRDAKGEVISISQAWTIIADLVRNAKSELDKIDLAKAAGQSEAMVRFLEQGSAKTRELQKAAADAAPDLQRLANASREFDAMWKAAVDNVKAYVVDTLLVSVRNTIIELIDMTVKFLGLFKGGLLDAQASAATEKWLALKTAIENVGAAASKTRSLAPAGNTAGGGTTTRDPAAPLSQVPTSGGTGGGDARDSFDRATDSINRHIAALQAEAAAVGLSKAAREQLRVEMRLLEAARQSDVAITDEQMAAYSRLRAQGLEPLIALQQAGINLTKEQQAAFIGLSARIGEVVTQAQKASNAFQGVNDALRYAGNELVSMIDRASQKGADFGAIMQDVLRKLTMQMLQAAITGEGAFAKLFGMAGQGGGTGGLFGLLARAFSSTGTTAPVPTYATGTDNAPGGMAWVHKDELINLPRGSRVIPKHIVMQALGAGGSGGLVFSPVTSIDARGSQMTEGQIRMILAQSNSRLLAQVKRDFPGRLAQFNKLGS